MHYVWSASRKTCATPYESVVEGGPELECPASRPYCYHFVPGNTDFATTGMTPRLGTCYTEI